MKAPPMKEIPLSEARQDFFAEKKAMNLSSSTLRTYGIHIDDFIESIGLTYISDISQDSIRRYVTILQNRESVNDVSTASYCRSVRAFCYWLMDTGYLDRFKISIPRYQKRVKRCYTDSELKALLRKPESDCTETEYLCWVFANVACATGLRLSSILSLKVDDIQGEWLFVDHTKNNVGMRLYLNPDMQRILRQYKLLFGIDGYLFCSAEGTPYHKSVMSHMMNKYNEGRGVEQKGVHRFRHTFARNVYMQSHDVFALSKLLGHSSIAVTQGYLSDLGVETISVQNSYNPQEQFAHTTRRRGKLR